MSTRSRIPPRSCSGASRRLRWRRRKSRSIRTYQFELLDGDRDLFGDGSLSILSAPGHTAGHQSLLVHLNKTGYVLLTGDAVHFQSNWDNRRVPGFNVDHRLSLARWTSWRASRTKSTRSSGSITTSRRVTRVGTRPSPTNSRRDARFELPTSDVGERSAGTTGGNPARRRHPRGDMRYGWPGLKGGCLPAGTLSSAIASVMAIVM
jgi:hypothetical protein